MAVVMLSACGAGNMTDDPADIDRWELVEEADDTESGGPGYSDAGNDTQEAAIPSGTGETTKSDTDDPGNGYYGIYEQIVAEKEGDSLRFSLIYLDEDDMPELLVWDQYYETYSVYTVKDGKAFCMIDSMYTVSMSYYERGGIIALFARWNGGGDEGGYGEFYYQVSKDKTLTDSDIPVLQYKYDAVYDEDENWTGEGITRYYHVDQEIDETTYRQMAADLGIVEGHEIACADGVLEKSEMLTMLGGVFGPAKESGGKETEDFGAAKEAYFSVLDQLYTTYTLPDGTELGYAGDSDLSDNTFAIYDIDHDGQEELIIIWATTYTAGHAGIVYGFDSVSGTVRTELWEYPMLTFYDNGVVEAGLSHNQGLAGVLPENVDFWPYTLYQYDKGTDTYVMSASVDAWNKAFRENDYDGNAFPDDIDVDGDGLVYVIEIGEDKELLDSEAYRNWRDSVIGGAGEIKIPFEKMTGEWRVSH